MVSSDRSRPLVAVANKICPDNLYLQSLRNALAELDIEIRYRKGKDSASCDALSRIFWMRALADAEENYSSEYEVLLPYEIYYLFH